MTVLTHALLGLSAAALAAAGVRVAALAAPSGLVRIVAAAPLAAAAAVTHAWVLGLVALGTSPVALALAAAATYAAARATTPAPATTVAGELGTAWRRLGAVNRALLGAAVGGGAAWAAWQLIHPALGFDTVHYHLSEIAIWVDRGTPGSIEPVIPGLPVGNYPITNEVLLTWAAGVGRGLEPITLWPWIAVALMAAAAWAGLRALRVPRLQAGLAAAAVCLLPPVIGWQSNGAMTDGPALAWLVGCAALCAASLERPALLGPALVAAALAVGTKTTTAPAALIVLAAAGWAARGHLRDLRRPLVLALALGIAAGGAWYGRNLFDHGSPFWPLIDAPWGDPVPPAVSAVDTTFLDRPGDTIEAVGDHYLERFAAGLLLVTGGLLAPLAARSRAVLATAGATLVGLLLWMRAPLTGIPAAEAFVETTFSTTRYLLPVAATGAVALALAARDGGRVGRIAAGSLLGAAAVLGFVQQIDLGYPIAPALATPLAGAAVGALLALAAARIPRLPRVPAVAALLAAAVAGAALAIPASGYVERHADARSVLAYGLAGWLADRPGFGSGDEPVAMTPTIVGVAAGDRLSHPLHPIPHDESCARIRERARSGYVAVYRLPLLSADPAPVLRCLRGTPPAYDDGVFTVYGRTTEGASTPGRSTSPAAAATTPLPARAATSGVTAAGRAER